MGWFIALCVVGFVWWLCEDNRKHKEAERVKAEVRWRKARDSDRRDIDKYGHPYALCCYCGGEGFSRGGVDYQCFSCEQRFKSLYPLRKPDVFDEQMAQEIAVIEKSLGINLLPVPPTPFRSTLFANRNAYMAYLLSCVRDIQQWHGEGWEEVVLEAVRAYVLDREADLRQSINV